MKSNSFIKKHPTAAIVFFNVLLLFFIFIVFEIILRIFTPGWLDDTMNYLKTGKGFGYGNDSNWKIKYKDGNFYSFTPNSTFKVYHSEYENTVHINLLGGRSTVAPDEKVDTANLIPFIGDSFVMGVGVEDSENMVSLIKKSTRLNFLNLGVSGTCIPRQRMIINRRYNDLGNPNFVIYGFFIGNDFDDIRNLFLTKSPLSDSIRFKERTLLKNQPNTTTVSGKINNYISNNNLLKRIYFLHYIKQKILNIKKKRHDKNFDNMEPVYHMLDSSNTKYIQQARTLIDQEIELLSKEPYEPIVIIIPDRSQMDNSLRKKLADDYNINENKISIFLPQQILKEALHKYKIKYIDPTDCIISHFNEGMLYYKIDNHFTKLGHKVISECISDSLRTMINKTGRKN